MEKLYEKDKHINLVNENMTLDEWFDKRLTVCKAHCRETIKLVSIQKNIETE